MLKKTILWSALPAMLMALAGCGKSNAADIPTLIWWQIGSNSADLPKYSQILSEYTEKKIGVRLDIRQGSWATATQRFNAMINTGEYWDILFSDANSYQSFADLGAYADITEMVKTAAPKLYASIPPQLWEGVELNGVIYGVPTYKDSAATTYGFWDAAIVEKYGLNIDDVSWENMDRNFRKIKAGGEVRYPYMLSRSENDAIFLDYEVFQVPAIGIKAGDKSMKVKCTLEEPDIIRRFHYMYDWYNAGIVNPDANMIDSMPKYRPYFIAQAWPAVAGSYATTAGIERYLPAKIWGPVYSTGSIQGSINCVSVNSKYKEKALSLLELANTDPVFRDMLAYGIEGTHFHYVTMPDDGRRAVHKDRTDWPLVNYQEGNYFIETPEDTVPAGYWDQVRALNESADASPLLGFAMDLTPIETEVINCKNTWAKYYTDLRTGASNPDEILPKLIAELRRKGMDKIISETQRQIDIFLKGR